MDRMTSIPIRTVGRGWQNRDVDAGKRVYQPQSRGRTRALNRSPEASLPFEAAWSEPQITAVLQLYYISVTTGRGMSQNLSAKKGCSLIQISRILYHLFMGFTHPASTLAQRVTL